MLRPLPQPVEVVELVQVAEPVQVLDAASAAAGTAVLAFEAAAGRGALASVEREFEIAIVIVIGRRRCRRPA